LLVFQVASPTFHLFRSKLPSRAKLSTILDQNAFYNVPTRDILRVGTTCFLFDQNLSIEIMMFFGLTCEHPEGMQADSKRSVRVQRVNSINPRIFQSKTKRWKFASYYLFTKKYKKFNCLKMFLLRFISWTFRSCYWLKKWGFFIFNHKNNLVKVCILLSIHKKVENLKKYLLGFTLLWAFRSCLIWTKKTEAFFMLRHYLSSNFFS
jgi:hypothetical protein